MKRRYGIIFAAGTGILLVMTGQPGFGASPTQEQIEQALRPVPPALRQLQGLPTIGVPVRTAPDPNYTRASTSGGAVSPESGASRPSPRAAQAKPVPNVVPRGCPVQADKKGQPMID